MASERPRMVIGKEWKWPSPDDLTDWEAKIRARHTRSISPGNQLMLIRAVRSQRKVIEKLVKMLALEPEIESGAPRP